MSLLQGMTQFLFRTVLGKLIAYPIRRNLRRFEAATLDPVGFQQRLLQSILQFHATTAFGRDHGFATIRSAADFRRQLPLAGYEAIEPYINRVRKGEINALLADRRVHMFALTSGTTATRKYIPVTDHYLADYRRGWNIWGLKVFRDHPDVRMRHIVQLSGDWEETHTETGVPCGAVTGLTATMQKRVIRWLYCVPPCAGKIKDAASKYYLALRLSMAKRVGMIIAANPSTLINMARTGDQRKQDLIRDLHDGTLSPDLDIPDDVRAQIKGRLKANPAKAKELEEIVRRTGTLYPKDYWPNELVLGNWTGGSVGAYLRHYPQYYGTHPVRDVGLIASEGRFTLPLSDETPSGVLDITSHYFEFIPEAEADSANPTVLEAHELEKDGRYFIVPTTWYGLYRYQIHDLVRCTGFHKKTPLIEFLSKGAHFSNLTGEKLSEYQITHALPDVLREMNLTLGTYSVAPCWNDEQPYYGLFVEQGDLSADGTGRDLAERLDSRLRAVNIEYDAKRTSARLGMLRLELVPRGFWQIWDRERLRKTGGTLEQYKHPCLINDLKFAEEARRQNRVA